MRKIFFILFLFPCLFLGQNKTIDSLKIVLKNAKHDSTKCLTIGLLFKVETENDVKMELAKQRLQIAETNLSSNNKTERLFFLKQKAVAFINFGNIYNDQGDIPKALEYWQKGLKSYEKIGNKEGIAYSTNSIGTIYKNQGDIPKALEYFHKSLKIREELGSKKGIANSLNSIGIIYKDQGDLQKAMEYFHKSLKLREDVDDKSGLASSLNNIGTIYSEQRNNPKALECYNKSLNIYEEIGDKYGIAMSLNNIGTIYNDLGNSANALIYYQKSLKINKEISDKIGIVMSFYNIGFIYYVRGNLKEGFANAFSGMNLANELGFPECIGNSAKLLKLIFQKQNKYKEAFEMYELEIKMRDSINNQETQKASIKKQMQYTYEKQEAVAKAEHDAELVKQQAIADEKNRRQNIVIGSVAIGLLLVIIFAGFVFRSLRITRKQKVLIELKNKETEEQKHLIEEKQKEILDSIHYAKRIQTALITSEKYIERNLNKLIK